MGMRGGLRRGLVDGWRWGAAVGAGTRRPRGYSTQPSLAGGGGGEATAAVTTALNIHITPGITTVPEALAAAYRGFLDRDVPDPALSACHLMADALGMRWETGFARLMRVLEQSAAGKGVVDAASASPSASAGGGNARRPTPLNAHQAARFRAMCTRRAAHEPIQYIVGRWDFAGVTLRVVPPLLCPRPETEELVERVAEEVAGVLAEKQRRMGGIGGGGGGLELMPPPVRVLDIGCGTGAIGVALAARFAAAPVHITAIDVSQTAVDLANVNAAAVLGLPPTGMQNPGRAEGSKAHTHTPLRHQHTPAASYRAVLCAANGLWNSAGGVGAQRVQLLAEEPAPVDMVADLGVARFDVVVSNPPYIPAADMRALSRGVVDYEDRNALCGGEDGLDVVRGIVERLPEWTRPVGAFDAAVVPCWLEVDASHPARIERWLGGGVGDDTARGATPRVACVETRTDSFGVPRFAKLAVVHGRDAGVGA